MSLICRHGHFTADCKICSKGTVLETKTPRRRSTGSRPTAARTKKAAAPVFSGPHVGTPAYTDADGVTYVVRLEKVPGGVRLAEWAGAQLRSQAPQLAVADLAELAATAGEALAKRDADRLGAALRAGVREESPNETAVSAGRAGDFKEELRIEPVGEGRVRVARWVLRPGSGWELQDAPPMLPVDRWVQVLTDAARRGLVTSPASDPGDAVRL